MSNSSRNKTIRTELHEGKAYLNRCKQVLSPQENLDLVLDSTILGDMLEVCWHLPKESVDLLIVDPPYNMRKQFNTHTFQKKSDYAYEIYTKHWLSRLYPLLKPTGSIYVCCDWESSMTIGNAISDQYIIQNRITWQREKGRGAKANWKNGMEDIWFATKSKDYTFNLDAVKVRRRVFAPYRIEGDPKDWEEEDEGNFRDTCPSNFWSDISVPFWAMSENTAHPTQKPEKLIAKLILASSRKGDVVLDPFLGSGTTSVVAKKLGRHYIGIEREPRYCIWAEQRLEMAEETPDIQGFVDGVFWDRNTMAEQRSARRGYRLTQTGTDGKKTSK